MSRPWTPNTVHPEGGTTLCVKRCCERCGTLLGDVTSREMDMAVAGRMLPDVAHECPRCTPEPDDHRHTGRNPLRDECTCSGRCSPHRGDHDPDCVGWAITGWRARIPAVIRPEIDAIYARESCRAAPIIRALALEYALAARFGAQRSEVDA